VFLLAHGCTRHRFIVLAGWLLALATLGGLVLARGTGFTDDTTLPDSESATAYALLAQAEGDAADVQTGRIVWHPESGPVTAADVRAEITDLLTRVGEMPGVVSGVSPYTKAGAAQLNADARTAFATVTLTADADVDPVLDAVEASADDGDVQGLRIEAGGTAFTEQPSPGGVTEGLGIVVALLLLLLAFRSLAAAVLPIITGVAGVALSLLTVMAASNVIDLSSNVLTMGALIGLGVGIDYALFIVNRHRRGLREGLGVPAAAAAALSTSGRAVVFAGLTVVAALIGMVVIGLDALTGMAFTAAFTVLCTVLAALTLLPALLGGFGRRVLPRRQRPEPATGPSTTPTSDDTGSTDGNAGRRGGWAGLLQRHPLVATVGSLLVVGLLALPALQMRVGNADASSDPVGSNSREYFDLMSAGFGAGVDATLLLVARTDDDAAADAFTALVDQLPEDPQVASAVLSGRTGDLSIAALTPVHSAQTEQTSDLVHRLREQEIPAAEAGSTLQVYVGGTTATDIDMSDALIGRLPLYLLLVATLGFALLVFAFRSLLVPLLGAVSNLATICVGLGVITAIFQFGWGSEELGVGSGAPVMYLTPVLICGVLFGLSMDYQVFLVSSMAEDYRRTGDHRRAVRDGLRESAGVIGTAAAIMLAVFASFGLSGERIVASIGVGLAIAVLVDAVVVRLTLMPALLTLIGPATWFPSRRPGARTGAGPVGSARPEPVYSYPTGPVDPTGPDRRPDPDPDLDR